MRLSVIFSVRFNLFNLYLFVVVFFFNFNFWYCICGHVKCSVAVDAIDLTLILKSIGFRLESLDIDMKSGNGENISNTDHGSAESFPPAKSLSPSKQEDGNTIRVQITCGKSNIVSRMTYAMNDDNDCTCPHDAVMLKNTAFWEVQSTGLFINGRSLGTSPKVIVFLKKRRMN